METTLRLQIDGICIAVIAILWLSGERKKFSNPSVDARIYGVLLASTGVMLFLEAIAWLSDGKPGHTARTVVFVANALYYAVHTIPAVSYILYADFQIFRDEKRSSRAARPLVAIAAIVAVAGVLTPFTGVLFIVDTNNMYARGFAFPIFAVLQYGLVGYALGLVIMNVKKMNRRTFVTLLAYPLPMLLASVAQLLDYGLILIWPTTTLFLVASWSNIENHRSKTDYLTGTANRRSLDEELERRVESIRPGTTLCGLMIDLDDFKSINDRFGHEAGDRALEDVAKLLLASVRVDDMVARLGGDEFVVLADIKESAALEDLVERIERSVEHHNASVQRPYHLSLSIGRAIFDPRAGRAAADFLTILDTDMYGRKRAKKLD
ncbi:MAG: diguanylate cyclase domain-containing protein [Rectinemataceae bacterium]